MKQARLSPEENLLAFRLFHARQAAGLTQAELAAKIYVSTKTISRIENGHRGASSYERIRLAQACKVKSEYFSRPVVPGAWPAGTLHQGELKNGEQAGDTDN